MSRRSLAALAAAALVVASGCTALPALGSGADAGPPPSDEVASAVQSLETLSATQVSTLESNGTTNTTRVELRIATGDDGEGFRRFNRVLAPEEQAGDVTLADADRSLFYDASDNTVTRIPRTGDVQTLSDRADYYESVVAAARNGSTVTPPSSGVSPLPVVPTTTSDGPAVEPAAIDGYDVTYLGADQVAGRDAHGFRLTAVTEATIDVNRTLWLDAEYYYPLRSEQTVAFGDRTFDVTTSLENVTFDADLPADAFDWRPPADATEETLEFDSERYDSREALAAAAPLSVPDPELPAGYAFESGRVNDDGNVTQVSVDYAAADGDGTLSVSKAEINRNGSTDGGGGGGLDVGENVTVGGQEGTYLLTGQSAFVTWSCEDVQYNVMASDLDRETVLDVAESVTCQ